MPCAMLEMVDLQLTFHGTLVCSVCELTYCISNHQHTVTITDNNPILLGKKGPILTTFDYESESQTFITQHLSIYISWRYHGKKLRCISQHIAYVNDQVSEVDINVRCKCFFLYISKNLFDRNRDYIL
jgi:hypothetical protein